MKVIWSKVDPENDPFPDGTVAVTQTFASFLKRHLYVAAASTLSPLSDAALSVSILTLFSRNRFATDRKQASDSLVLCQRKTVPLVQFGTRPGGPHHGLLKCHTRQYWSLFPSAFIFFWFSFPNFLFFRFQTYKKVETVVENVTS